MSDTPLTEYEVAIETTAAPEPPLSFREAVEDALLNANAPVGNVCRLTEAVETLARDEALTLAGEAIRSILARLPDDCAASAALRRVVSGDATSLRECGRRAGVSGKTVHKHEQKIRRWLA
jgi:DNA-directed RNA polymerase specialized sigma24 family protein